MPLPAAGRFALEKKRVNLYELGVIVAGSDRLHRADKSSLALRLLLEGAGCGRAMINPPASLIAAQIKEWNLAPRSVRSKFRQANSGGPPPRMIIANNDIYF